MAQKVNGWSKLTEEQVRYAAYILHLSAQEVRKKLLKFMLDGKRPNKHDLESMAGLLYTIEQRVATMAGHPYPVSMPIYPDDWPPDTMKALELN